MVTFPAEKWTDFKRAERRMRTSISSTVLIPRNFLVALICTYDAFLGKLLRYIFEIKPEILDASERTITYSDLLEFQDIEAARNHLIEKETEAILRKSHIEHFAWLEKHLNCSFTNGLKSWPTFVELTQRRNLFVHADGIISSQYLSMCKDHKCELSADCVVGTKLAVPEKYFKESYKCLYEIGIKLTQILWRRLDKSGLNAAGSNLVETTINLIENQDYDIAIRVLEFFTSKDAKHDDESMKRVHVINLAQSYKWSNRPDDCKMLLDSYDWSGWEDKFRLALFVLNDNWDESFACMRRLAHNAKFSKSSYRDWPLLKELRRQDNFPTVFNECYNEDFSSRESVSKGPENESVIREKSASSNTHELNDKDVQVVV